MPQEMINHDDNRKKPSFNFCAQMKIVSSDLQRFWNWLAIVNRKIKYSKRQHAPNHNWRQNKTLEKRSVRQVLSFKIQHQAVSFAVFYNYFENEDEIVADCSYFRTPSAFNLLSILRFLSADRKQLRISAHRASRLNLM